MFHQEASVETIKMTINYFLLHMFVIGNVILQLP